MVSNFWSTLTEVKLPPALWSAGEAGVLLKDSTAEAGGGGIEQVILNWMYAIFKFYIRRFTSRCHSGKEKTGGTTSLLNIQV